MRKGILVGVIAAAAVATGSGAVSAQVAVSDSSTDTSTHARHDPWPKTDPANPNRHDPWPKAGAVVTAGYGYKTTAGSISSAGPVVTAGYGYKTGAASISGIGAVQGAAVSGIALASVATGGWGGWSTGSGVRIRTRPTTSATVVGYLQYGERVWINCFRHPGDGYVWYSLKRGTSPGPSIGWSRSDNIKTDGSSSYRLPQC